jgi:hypothetical protein
MGWRIGCELSKKQARALDGPHCVLSLGAFVFIALMRRGKFYRPSILAKNFHLSIRATPFDPDYLAKKFPEFDIRNF